MTIKERRSTAPPEDLDVVTATAEAYPIVEATAIVPPEPVSAPAVATPVSSSVASAVVPPPVVRVISPATLPEGATFRAVVDGIEFNAKVPPGGVRQGETFETLFPRTIQVIAPLTLNAGDRFEAEVDGIRFLATVPVGGVRQGDLFETLHPSVTSTTTTTDNTRRLTPRWRTGLCDCCDCNKRDCCSLCCMATFCTIVVSAQIMQRLNLTLAGCKRYGNHSSSNNNNNNYAKIGVCPLLLTITASLFGLLVLVSILRFAVGISIVYLSLLGWCVFLFAAMVCTRKSMREHYKLPGACCIDGDCVDDFCVTYWCSCCSAIQMARHTHDSMVHPYDCCSPTGLGRNAPPCVVV